MSARKQCTFNGEKFLIELVYGEYSYGGKQLTGRDIKAMLRAGRLKLAGSRGKKCVGVVVDSLHNLKIGNWQRISVRSVHDNDRDDLLPVGDVCVGGNRDL